MSPPAQRGRLCERCRKGTGVTKFAYKDANGVTRRAVMHPKCFDQFRKEARQ
jgi:hypothetical protein